MKITMTPMSGGFKDPGMVSGSSKFGTTKSVKMGSAFVDPGIATNAGLFGIVAASKRMNKSMGVSA